MTGGGESTKSKSRLAPRGRGDVIGEPRTYLLNRRVVHEIDGIACVSVSEAAR